MVVLAAILMTASAAVSACLDTRFERGWDLVLIHTVRFVLLSATAVLWLLALPGCWVWK